MPQPTLPLRHLLACLVAAPCLGQITPVELAAATEHEFAEPGARGIALADLDGDGNLDVAMACNGSDSGPGTLSVLLGDGAGGFSDDPSTATVPRPWGLAAADLDEDGILDLVVTDSGSESRQVAVLLGRGDGGFDPAGILTAGKFPLAVVCADFDGDQHTDIAVASNVLHGLTVFLGQGDGSFGPADSVSGLASTHATDLAAGDLDHDGDVDLVLSHYDGVRIVLGNGDGTFVPAGTAGAGVLTESVDVGDYDGDGHLDVASTLLYQDQLVLRRGLGNGSFASGATFSTGSFVRDVALCDLNLDGLVDIVLSSEGQDRLEVRLGSGGGSFLPVSLWGTGYQPGELAVGDLDRDGYPDLLAGLRNPGNNALVAVHPQVPPQPSTYCTAKRTSNGCLPSIGWSGSTSLGSTDPLYVTAVDVLNHQFGLMFYGPAPAAVPFLGGTRCVANPLTRTSVQVSGGNPGAPDCSGSFSFDLKPLLLSGLDPSLALGRSVHCQYWFRDPASPTGGAGLSDGLVLPVAP